MYRVRRAPYTVLAVAALALTTVIGTTGRSGATFTSTSVNPGGGISAAADWTPPTVRLLHPGAVVRGAVYVGALSSDAETGVARVVISAAPTGTANWSPLCTITAEPWLCSVDTTAGADGVFDLQAVATDLAGYSSSSVVTGVRVDNTPPALALTAPAAPLKGTISMVVAIVENGSGPTGGQLQYSPVGAATWTTAPCTIISTATQATCQLDTTSIADGTYDFRAVVPDAAGNVGTSNVVTREIVNRSSVVSLQDPGARLRGTVTFNATASSNLGVNHVRIQRASAATGTPWSDVCIDSTSPYACTVSSATIPDGTHYFRAVMYDGGGNINSSTVIGPRVVDNSLVRGIDIQAIGSGNAYFGSGDVFLYTYSEVIQPGTLIAGWNGASRSVGVRLRDVSAGIRPSDFFEVYTDTSFATTVAVGQVELNLNSMSGAPNQALFDGTIAMETTTVNGRQVTRVRVTVGDWRWTGNAWPNTVTAQMIWYPSGLAKDLWNVGTSTAPVYESGPLDKDY